MNWGRLDEPTWWWEFALDGVVGGVIGGLVTALAVWLTLRHERKLFGDQGDRENWSTDRAEARANALSMRAALMRMHPAENVSIEDLDDDEALLQAAAAFERLYSALIGRWPRAAEKLWFQNIAYVVELYNPSRTSNGIRAKRLDLERHLDRWMVDSEAFEVNEVTRPASRRGRRS